MILLLHPRATRPKNRRFPLPVLALAAMIEGREEYAIVDGNLDPDPWASIERLAHERPVELLAVSVMPGPQMVAAIPLCRAFREKYPRVPIVWGGYFPSLYPDAALNARYVDFVVRGQGEEAFLELIAALRTDGRLGCVRGLSWKDRFGLHVHNPERPLRAPDEFPLLPYHRVDASRYLLPTFLGSRTAVHQASVGCPFHCKFCGVITAYGSREKAEAPAHTAAVLGCLKERYGVDAVQFYDNNFFLGESHTAELADRLAPLELRWWCEGRIDTILRYSDATFRKLRRAGAAMIFFGAESGSDWVLKEMNKQLTADQTLALAERIRHFGIVPEFSFVMGNPRDPERDVRECLAFIRKLKKINPEAEIIVYPYIPTPQRERMYGDVEVHFPETPEEWATERWHQFTVRADPSVPWLPRRLTRRITDFERVINCRWPTIQDIRMPRWGRALLKTLASWRYATRFYRFPVELEWAERLVDLRKPRLESL